MFSYHNFGAVEGRKNLQLVFNLFLVILRLVLDHPDLCRLSTLQSFGCRLNPLIDLLLALLDQILGVEVAPAHKACSDDCMLGPGHYLLS